MSKCATLLLLFALPLTVLKAQEDRGTIAGSVTDPGGAIVPNALVTAVQSETSVKYKTTSNDSGEFTIPSLPIGNYRISIEAVGFKTAIFDKGSLTGGGVLRLNARLEVGAVQRQIEVSAESSSILQMDDAKIRNEIPYQLIQGLPTLVAGNMRSPFDLANLTPGVEGTDQDVRIGGGQQAAWGATLDGGSVAGNRLGSAVWSGVNSPALDAIDQFTVNTDGFKAEYGRAGGGLISFVSKSGTDQYHGDAFEFVRNNYFDARGFFAKSVAIYRQHDASGTPLSFSGAFGFPGNTINNRPTITTYDGWRGLTAGDKFDPAVDRYFQTATLANFNGDVPTITQQGWFPLQPRDRIGNMTVTNPKMRNFPIFNENVSLAKTFSLSHENKREFDVRLEGFNLLNRTRFATPNTNLSSTSFGLVTAQANPPRNLQLAMKLIW